VLERTFSVRWLFTVSGIQFSNQLPYGSPRFTQSEVRKLVQVLEIPERVKVEDGSRVHEDALTALAMLLKRLSTPGPLHDIEAIFGWERTKTSRITRCLTRFIYNRWKHLLFFDARRLTPEKLEDYAYVIHQKGAPASNVWGFIDGTLRATARPVRNQRLVYNGWKRHHGLKFHSILTPDGLHCHAFGPETGKTHDSTLFTLSGLDKVLQQHSRRANGEPLAIYGDPAYSIGPHVMTPFERLQLTDEQAQFNNRMSKVREAVEWGFGEATRVFPFLDFSRNMKILLSPVGLYYLVGLLFCNAHTILHYPLVPQYFLCSPPTLEEYFLGVPHQQADSSPEVDSISPWIAVDTNIDDDDDSES
jgi:hypothetical protein